MKTKRVNRYYCDYCGKGGCAAGHMKKHEDHCTMNPDRECRMCQAMNERQPDLAGLIASLPDMKIYEDHTEYGGYSISGASIEIIKKDVEKMRIAANECPVCMLAALRQAKISTDMIGFHFKKECDAVWSELNEQERKKDEAAFLVYGEYP